MSEFISGSALFAILLTFGAYELGRMFQKKTRMAIFNPILVAALLVGVVLVLTGTPNQVYQDHCETFSWLLTPATVCLAIPLYAQFSRLRHDLPAILAGVTAGTLVSMGFVLLLTRHGHCGERGGRRRTRHHHRRHHSDRHSGQYFWTVAVQGAAASWSCRPGRGVWDLGPRGGDFQGG